LALTRTQQILRDRLYAELTPVVAALGLDLVEVELTPVGHDQRVGLIVDRPAGHGPVKIDDCARSSRAVSAYLDTVNPFENEYDLEVSSPGTDRKLRDLVDVARFVGNTAKIQVTGNSSRLDDGAKEALQGVLVAVETTADGHSGLRVRIGKKASSERLLAWSDVVVARLALTPDEWDALGRKLMAEQSARTAAGLDAPAGAEPGQAEDEPDDDLDDDELDDDELDSERDEPSAR
jgi:ribosome maturation factor RimP